MTSAGLLRLARGAALAGLWSTASATVYRCGNAYADVPCPRAAVVDAADPRSDADRAAAREVAAREAALAARMVADRESAERLSRPTGPARVRSPSRASSSAVIVQTTRRTSRDRLRVDVDGNFVAVIPRKR